MKFRITAALSAAAIIAGALSFSASAEEQYELKLLSEPVTAVGDVKYADPIGGGFCLCYGEDDKPFKMIYIGDEETADWRKTGVFRWKEVECGIDLSDYCWCSGKPEKDGNFFGLTTKNGMYYQYYYCESNYDHTKITAEPFDVYWANVRSDGYVFAAHTTAYMGKGTELADVDLGYESGAGHFALRKGEYLGGIFYWSDPYYNPYEYDERFYFGTLRLADKNGNVTEIYRTPEPQEDNYCSFVSWDSMALNNSAICWRENYTVNGEEIKLQKIYDFQSGEMLEFPYIETLKDGREIQFAELHDGVWDGRAIMALTLYSVNYNFRYALADTETGEYVSDTYKSLDTRDGEHFLFEKEDGTWGFIDRNGKILYHSGDVSDFSGSYAMVSENGQGFLIGKNMTRVSEIIPSDSAFAGDTEGLYFMTSGGKMYFVTYADADGSDIPGTGNTSVTAMLIFMLLSAAAAFSYRKQKR